MKAAVFATGEDADPTVEQASGSVMRIEDPLCALLDVVAVNEYVGWYYKSAEDCLSTTWRTTFEKPVVISEFGAGAKAGFRDAERRRFSEEFQLDVYRAQFAMIEKNRAVIRGASPWILADFLCPRRFNQTYQNLFNRKGLMDHNGNRKLAWGFVREVYERLAMVGDQDSA
ncbi:Beta-glucuronidase [Mucisphaera calidilacus]|uniref:Beta-glucuronidase n=1 Tax=Mucisphaera calidilacus TaxID=2527982 RepID=A0A518BUA4_9BACT|nr:Beta-glucuronidase [Mucisphaera calidilacus]